MATIPVCNPRVPFLGKLPRPVRVGTIIKIFGKMTRKCGPERFSINLQNGPSTNPLDSTPLHLSIRPKERTIVRNHYECKWGAEERSCHCPITPGCNYEIVIAVGCDMFSVSVNGVHYCDFRYRLRFECISYINIDGDTTISSIDMNCGC